MECYFQADLSVCLHIKNECLPYGKKGLIDSGVTEQQICNQKQFVMQNKVQYSQMLYLKKCKQNQWNFKFPRKMVKLRKQNKLKLK